MGANWVASIPKDKRLSQRLQALQTKATIPLWCLKSSRVQCVKIASSKSSKCLPTLIVIIIATTIMLKFYDQRWEARRVRTLLFKLCRISQQTARFSRIMRLTIKICSFNRCSSNLKYYQTVKSWLNNCLRWLVLSEISRLNPHRLEGLKLCTTTKQATLVKSIKASMSAILIRPFQPNLLRGSSKENEWTINMII